MRAIASFAEGTMNELEILASLIGITDLLCVLEQALILVHVVGQNTAVEACAQPANSKVDKGCCVRL